MLARRRRRSSEKPKKPSRRKLRFTFPSSTFSQTTETPSAPSELALLIDTERFRYLELGVDLEVDRAAEADRDVNDLLDVLITATNPPPECTCDDCEEFGPAGFEPDESDPESQVPVPVGPGDRRKAVGLAQILLNDFIAQARLGVIVYTGAEDPADAQKKLDALPTFIPVQCKFDQTTADAVVLFRTWHGDLGSNPDLDKEGWTRLIQVTEIYESFVHREFRRSPSFRARPTCWRWTGSVSPIDSCSRPWGTRCPRRPCAAPRSTRAPRTFGSWFRWCATERCCCRAPV